MAPEQNSDTVLRLLGELERGLATEQFLKEPEQPDKLLGNLIRVLDDVFDPVDVAPDQDQKRRIFNGLNSYTRRFVKQSNDILTSKIKTTNIYTIKLSHVLYVLADYIDDEQREKIRKLSRSLLIYVF